MSNKSGKYGGQLRIAKIVIVSLCAVLIVSLLISIDIIQTKKAEKNPSAPAENLTQSVQKADVDDNSSENTKPEHAEKNSSEITLNIKPLEETDAELLASSAQLLGFENTAFFHAFANAIDKAPSEVTQQDVDNIHYIALGPDEKDKYSLFVGYIDYIDLCLSEAATDENVLAQLNEIVMMSDFSYSEEDSLSDLGNFKNLEMFEIYDVNISDVSFVNNYNKLIFGYFKNNGITDVSSLADYNPDSLFELDFTGNEIADWSYLEHIKEKVLVFYDINSGVSLTLENYLEQLSNPVPDISTTPSSEEIKEPVLVDENGNPADFSSLFD